jgi:hypothetical protein
LGPLERPDVMQWASDSKCYASSSETLIVLAEKIFRHKMEGVAGSAETWIREASWFILFLRYYKGDHFKENDMGWTCSKIRMEVFILLR